MLDQYIDSLIEANSLTIFSRLFTMLTSLAITTFSSGMLLTRFLLFFAMSAAPALLTSPFLFNLKSVIFLFFSRSFRPTAPAILGTVLFALLLLYCVRDLPFQAQYFHAYPGQTSATPRLDDGRSGRDRRSHSILLFLLLLLLLICLCFNLLRVRLTLFCLVRRWASFNSFRRLDRHIRWFNFFRLKLGQMNTQLCHSFAIRFFSTETGLGWLVDCGLHPLFISAA